MKNYIKNYLVFVILISVLIAPSFVLAAWWNPLSWHIWGIFNIFSKPQTSIIQPTQNTNQNQVQNTTPQTPTNQTAPVVPSALTLISPINGSRYSVGQTMNIKWTGGNSTDKYIIILDSTPTTGGHIRVNIPFMDKILNGAISTAEQLQKAQSSGDMAAVYNSSGLYTWKILGGQTGYVPGHYKIALFKPDPTALKSDDARLTDWVNFTIVP